MVSVKDRNLNKIMQSSRTMDMGIDVFFRVPMWFLLLATSAFITSVDGNVPPQWVNYQSRIFVSEDENVSSVIATLHGKDEDGDTLTFDVQGSQGVLIVLRTSDNSATVVLRNMLDREAVDRYNLTFMMSDGFNDRVRRYCTMYVLDTNDNAPHFMKEFYRASVTEDTAKGREVLRVSALDPDLSHEGLVTYTEDPQGSWSDFMVDWVSGVIRVNGDLDLGKKNYYDLTVRATDGGGLFSTVPVEIRVTGPSSNTVNNELHCFYCDKTSDCGKEQLSYSTTSRCKPNQLCFIDAIQEGERSTDYKYSRGCRDVNLCGERNMEICTSEYDRRNCSTCCSDRICNGGRLNEPAIQKTKEPEWSNFTVDWVNGVIRFNLGFDNGDENPYGLSLKAIDVDDSSRSLQVQIQITNTSATNVINDQFSQALKCYNCDKSTDCAKEQLSYSLTRSCEPNQLCFVEAVLQPPSTSDYEYFRGCRDENLCGEKNKEICTVENNVRHCQMCCSDSSCNKDQIKEHRIQEAKSLLAETTTGKSNRLKCTGTIFMILLLMVARSLC